MDIAATAVSVLLASLLVVSACRKLSHNEVIVQDYVELGVPEKRLNLLAAVLLLAALGLLVGIGWPQVSIATSLALIVYFAVALVFHVRANELRSIATPIAFALLAAGNLALQVPAITGSLG